MWHEIKNQVEADAFMEHVEDFHDSCIKELSYISGAYVENDLSMYPVNEKRALRVAFQRQFAAPSMIEMAFTGLRYLKITPNDMTCTCEISDATLLVRAGRVCWCDRGGITSEGMLTYDGTVICAEKVCWRPIEGHMGEAPFYLPADGGWGDAAT